MTKILKPCAVTNKTEMYFDSCKICQSVNDVRRKDVL